MPFGIPDEAVVTVAVLTFVVLGLYWLDAKVHRPGILLPPDDD